MQRITMATGNDTPRSRRSFAPRLKANTIASHRSWIGFAMFAFLLNAIIFSFAAPASAESVIWLKRLKGFEELQALRDAAAANPDSSAGASIQSFSIDIVAPASFSIDANGSWAPTSNTMANARILHTATRLNDGRVLV